MDKNKIKTIETIYNGDKIKLDLLYPTNKILSDATRQYNIKIAQLLRNSSNMDGLLTRSQLNKYLDGLGVWTAVDQNNFIMKQLEIRELEKTLMQGGIELIEAKSIAIKMKILRRDLMQMHMRRSEFDASTIESVAEEHKLHYIISRCTFEHETDKLFFLNMEDYKDQMNEPYTIDITIYFSSILYGYDENIMNKLTENQFLMKYNFMDKDGNLIENGKFIDLLGRQINSRGQLINNKGQLIDAQGNRVDEDGNFIIKQKPFKGIPKKKKNRIGQKR